MPAFLSGLKSPCYLLLLSASLLLSPAAWAQRERVLQQVDLRLPGNLPMYTSPYLLPELVAQGIEAGKITPYRVDYETNSISPMSLAQYRKSLKYKYISLSEETWDPRVDRNNDTLELNPAHLHLLELDVIKEQGLLKKINYLHFNSIDFTTGFIKYHYSVSFPELAAYLQETKAIWVKNTSPLVWRNQVLHTHDRYPPDVLSRMLGLPAESESLLLHFAESRKRKYLHLELFSKELQLVRRIPYQDLLPAKDSSDIRWLDEALQAGLYQVGFADPRDGEEAEQKLNTTLPEAAGVAFSRPAPAAFSIIQGDRIHTLRPENKKFIALEKSLVTFVSQALTQGRFESLYSSFDLSEPMKAADWQELLSQFKEQAASTASSPDADTSRFIIPITLYWKVSFNDKGKITASQPLSLAFWINFSHTENRELIFTGYISFEEAVKTLKEKPAARLLADLRRRKYFALWDYSSLISVENPQGSKQNRK